MRKFDYRQTLHEWNGTDPDWRLYRALGAIAVGDNAGRFVGHALLEPIGNRVYQLLEIAIDEGLRSESNTGKGS